MIKLLKPTDRGSLGSSRRERTLGAQGSSVRVTADFSSETMGTRRQWDDVFKVCKEKTVDPEFWSGKIMLQKRNHSIPIKTKAEGVCS